MDSQFLQICSLDFSIGNVLLTPNTEYKNELINDNTYLISDLNTLKIISKEELQEKINNNSYLYINERTIPGITSRKYV